MRQRSWLELMKEYDMTIHYHPGKENVIADAFSRKSFDNLAYVITTQPTLLEDLIWRSCLTKKMLCYSLLR